MLETQMNILETLEKQTDQEKLDMLFLLLDRDDSGSIDAVELTNFMRKMNEGMTYAGSIDMAIDYVAANDMDLSGALGKDEFKTYLDLVCNEVGSTFHEMCELILMNIYFSKNGNNKEDEAAGKLAAKQIKERVQTKAGYYATLQDGRMRALFNDFDTNNTGKVDYQEAAIGLYKLIGDMKESALEAFDLLLMYDKNDDQLMDYTEFVRLMLHACALKEKTWSEIADALVHAIKTNPDPSEDDLAKLGIAEENYTKAAEITESSKKAEAIMTVLHYQKFMKLYDIADSNDDGMICFEELAIGLRKYAKAMSVDESLDTSISEAKGVLISFDKDENQKLDRDEFALVLVEFAHMKNIDILKLIDFLAIITLTDSDVLETAYINQISMKQKRSIKKWQDEFAPPPSQDNDGWDEGVTAEDGVVQTSRTSAKFDDNFDQTNVVYGKNFGTFVNPNMWA